MKIAILGTKGIPNNYGGFEQFAEFLSVRLVKKGHEVTVYNPSFHSYKKNEFEGVKIKTVFSPEKWMGGAANFIYDHLCLKDALKCNYDIIYEAGYHSVALSYIYFNVKKIKRPVVLTNMDGLEWKRSKWNYLARQLIVILERLAVKNSPHLISDNLGIQQYYKEVFKRDSLFIPYGANLVDYFDKTILKNYDLIEENYNLIIARLEPENNIENILQGYVLSSCKIPLVIIGNNNTKYGQFLQKKYKSDIFRFIGSIYNKSHLDALRHFSLAYFHGHSVGGTNPSLLEAMASHCFIVSHDNPFNRSVLEDTSLYFKDSRDLSEVLIKIKELKAIYASDYRESNLAKVKDMYNWDLIVSSHEKLFASFLNKV